MRSKITKLAVAAVVIIAVGLSIMLLDKTVTPTYAIEQTIEAMSKIKTVHAFGLMKDGSEYECWVQKSQDANGIPNICLYLPDVTVVSAPNWSYLYNSQDDTIKELKGGYLQARADFSNIVQWIYEELVVPGLCNLKLEQIIRQDGKRQIQARLTGQFEAIFFIDAKTKLLDSAEIFSGEKGDYVIKTIDRITYNAPIPDGIFEYQAPNNRELLPSEPNHN